MRLLSCAAALVLLTGRVFAQLDMYGLMEDPAQQFWQSGVARPPFLARRDGDCGTGKHPCSDINSTLCCPNTQYCIVSETDFTAQCCDVGSNCGNPCSASMYLTSKLTTITVSTTTSVSTELLCATRKCTSSYYGCPASLGGQCCTFGLDCATDSSGAGICVGPSTASSSSTPMSTLVTPLASGCTAQGQTYCTAGGGCCGAGYTCTLVSSTQIMCASATAPSSTTLIAPTGSGITVVPKAHGLSSGAKAGIAVAVVVVAGSFLGVLTWLCLRRRRSSKTAAGGGSQQAQELASVPPIDHRQSGITSDGGLRPYAASSGPHVSEVDGRSSVGYPVSSYGGTNYGGGGGGGAGANAAGEVSYSEMGGGTLGPGQAGVAAAATTGGLAAANDHHNHTHNPATLPEYHLQGQDQGQAHGYRPDEAPTAELGTQHARSGSGYSLGRENSRTAAATAPTTAAGTAAVGPSSSVVDQHQHPHQHQYQDQPTSPVESTAGRFELDAGAGGGYYTHHHQQHQEQQQQQQRPQPLATPVSEYSELPSPGSVSEVHDRETW